MSLKMYQIETLRIADLDCDEKDALARIVAEAKSVGGYLHIEIRKASDSKE